MKWDDLTDFIKERRQIAYDEHNKKTFRRVGNAALKELAKYLVLTKRVDNCNISYNKAGIACSGDFHLRGDFVTGGSFDFFFNLDGFNQFYTYRKTTAQDDYTGGANCNLRLEADLAAVSRAILLMQGERHAMPEMQI